MGFATITDEAAAKLRARGGKPNRRFAAPFHCEINGEAARNFAGASGDEVIDRLDAAVRFD